MKSKKIILSCIVCFFTFFNCYSQDPYGTYEGEYNNVFCYSNGSTTYNSGQTNSVTINGHSVSTGLKYQCVEFVQRYYAFIYGLEIDQYFGNANSFYSGASGAGLVAYANGTIEPKVGDIVCSNGGTYGHVAIIRDVTSTSVTVIQQNWSNTSADLNKVLTRSGNTIGSFSASYSVIGVVRRQCTSTSNSEWDFTTNQLCWTIRQDAAHSDFLASDWWRLISRNKQPQIISPDLTANYSSFNKIAIRLSITATAPSTICRVYFDMGSGFGASCMSQKSVNFVNNVAQDIEFDIPSCASGNIKRVMFDLYDNATITNGTIIAIQWIKFKNVAQNVTVNCIADPTNGGTTNPNGYQSYTAGQTATINAIQNTGWHFVEWKDENNTSYTSNPYSFTINSNKTFTAYFELDNTGIEQNNINKLSCFINNECLILKNCGKNAMITIYNIEGKKMINASINENECFNVTCLKNGIYYLKVETGNKTYNMKICK